MPTDCDRVNVIVSGDTIIQLLFVHNKNIINYFEQFKIVKKLDYREII